jgi:hypothetical protein
MKAKSLPPRPARATVVAAVLSVLISTALLSGVARLFLHDGRPLQSAVAAERACGATAFLSDRDACVRALLAATYHRRIASRASAYR